MQIPKGLLDQVKEGNVVLFLGSGASIGAKHPKGIQPPIGQELANKIATKFLGKNYLGYPLSSVSELVISERDLFTLQQFIYDEFIKFRPGDHHKLIPTFKWKAIFTTNYDLLIEQSYSDVSKKLQDIVPFRKNGESINEKLLTPNSLMYIKLHGCMSNINDEHTPLILTPDQYITHRKNREWLFDRLTSYSYNYPILFVGTSLSDYDIRAILNHIEVTSSSRTRSYIVGPNITPEESRLWEGKKITSITSSFDEFINQLDAKIPEVYRKLSASIPSFETPIYTRFVTDPKDKKPTEGLLSMLENDVQFLHNRFADETTDPKDFYKGYFTSWDPIISNYDVPRKMGDEILSQILFIEDDDIRPELHVIKGHAGSGKTVLLKRTAWDSAVEFEKLCLYVKDSGYIHYEPLAELYGFCKERIYLFLDNAADNLNEIIYLLNRAKKDDIALTIVTAERINIWNVECGSLAEYLTEQFELKYLELDEIENLIKLLEKHKSLNYLEKLNHDERVAAFAEIAGKQLLVALYEATQGKPFEDIIVDEYNSIENEEAKSLYLTVCLLHRFGAETRAGLISRVHGISFSHFKEKLFKPLEFVVFNRMNYRINDYVYLTRHQYIAQIVFEEILSDPQDKFDEFIRLISCLDIDYSNDRLAFISMTKAKNLLETFKDPVLIRKIYEQARIRVGDNPKLLQQEAIFEMKSSAGQFHRADSLLSKAHKYFPEDMTISHSFAEMSLKKAEKAKNNIEKIKYLNDAKKICNALITNNCRNSHNHHTLLKAYLMELKIAQIEHDSTSLERIIKKIEKALGVANQYFPRDSFIIESESNYKKILDNIPDAISLLEKSFQVNKSSPFIAIRLAKMYELDNKVEEAKRIIKEALQVKSGDKDLNFKYAEYLLTSDNPNLQELKHYLRRSFTRGDSRYHAQFNYARCLFLINEREESLKFFDELKSAPVDPFIKKEPRGIEKRNGSKLKYSGTITKIEASYGFVERDVYADSIYFYRYNTHKKNWVDLRKGSRINFYLEFNYRGPIATNIMLVR